MSTQAAINRKIRASYFILIWLAEQTTPSWGDYIERGAPPTDEEMILLLEQGIIEQRGMGYWITEKGRKLVT